MNIRQSHFGYILAFFVVLCLCASASWADQPLRIGAVFGMSGNVASYGNWAEHGARLAVNEVNKAGGINGQTLTLVIEDSEGQPSTAVSAYQKLRSVDHVDYVMTFLSSIALAIEPLANRDGVVQMDISATTPAYSTPKDFTFRTGAVATQVAAEAARKLWNQYHIQQVACISIENEFGQGMFDVFHSTYQGKIVASQTFRQDDGDFRAQLLKLKSSGVRDIWFVGHLHESGLLVYQASQLGMHARFFSDAYSVEGNEFLASARGQAEGLIYFSPGFDTDSADPEVKKFVQLYRDAYREDPTYFAAQSYDGVLALVHAMSECKSLSASCVQERLYRVDFSGASGRIRFDKNGDVKKEIVQKVVHNGKFEFVR